MHNLLDSRVVIEGITMENPDHSPEFSFAYSSLEQLRKRLLDLTNRNRLLNFKHGKTGNIRVIDELPDQLYELLFSEETLRFIPVPEPSEEELLEKGYLQYDEEADEIKSVKAVPKAIEWAKELGFNVRYDLPSRSEEDEEEKHSDNNIQTLYYAYELESQLRKIRSKAVSSIEETGANILFMAFGFLEWFESNDSSVFHHAPLILIPLEIKKGQLNKKLGTYEYTITYSGEEILPNLSLREKLYQDFGLELPEFEQETYPDEYFLEVQRVVLEAYPRWSIKRQVTLGMFNFSKLLMYLDLDPDKWPTQKRIDEHPVVCKFFSALTSQEQGSSTASVEEYKIDDIPGVHDQYPLIDDADSSQHSALIDAVSGKNLVIEGPPGTGKSQTITNLIAAALAQGKRVLFVAEKLAALEVVKRRLDNAGVGDFCLELHSHKTQKRKILDDIQKRLASQGKYRHGGVIDSEVRRYESLKVQLQQYVELINRPYKRTGLTIHEILSKATRYREEVNQNPSLTHPEGLDGEACTVEKRLDLQEAVRAYCLVSSKVAAQFGAGGQIQNHPWFGFKNDELQPFDEEQVVHTLERWQKTVVDLKEHGENLSGLIRAQVTAEGVASVSSLVNTCLELCQVKRPVGNEQLSKLAKFSEQQLEVLSNFIAQYDQIHDLRDYLKDKVPTEILESSQSIEQLLDAEERLQYLDADSFQGLSGLADELRKLTEYSKRLTGISVYCEQIINQLGQGLSEHVNMSVEGLCELNNILSCFTEIQPHLLKLRSDLFDDYELDAILPELAGKIGSIRKKETDITAFFSLKKVGALDELQQLKEITKNKSLFRWLKRDWREAKKKLLSYAADSELKYDNLVEQLNSLIEYKQEIQDLTENQKYKNLLRDHFTGLSTPVDDLLTLRRWYRDIRLQYGSGFGPKSHLGQLLLQLPLQVIKAFQELITQGFASELEAVIAESSRISEVFPTISEKISNGQQLNTVVCDLASEISIILEPFSKIVIDANATVEETVKVVSTYKTYRKMCDEWEQAPINEKVLGGKLSLAQGDREENTTFLDIVKNSLALVESIYLIEDPSVRSAVLGLENLKQLEQVQSVNLSLLQSIDEYQTNHDNFIELAKTELDDWCQKADCLNAITEKNERALSHTIWFNNWLEYVQTRTFVKDKGLQPIISLIEERQFSLQHAEEALLMGMFDLLARGILLEHPELARFSGGRHEALRKEFHDCDNKLKALQQEKIASRIAQNPVPAGRLGGRVSEYSEAALLEHECGKKKRHIPIRQLVRRAGQALVALKPCFMMGPMSVAQYLPQGEIEFDIVVMDEASQMKPEDALGTVARGKQLVVVGDPKQLPPTSFFDKNVFEEHEDLTAIEESESILDATLPMFQCRRLRWHYRSQHESLIAFSNHSFYDGNLVIFPSANNSSEEYGVKLSRVVRGRFIDNVNIEEARLIAEAVKQHLIKRPDESIGIVAMNAKQREQIERSVEELCKDDVTVQRLWEKNSTSREPLFVKNLENVQGDERDVILISITYGPQEYGGRVLQRFGPINSEVGWRRLNVLFTRARKRMHVFSSFGAEDVVITDQSKRGVKALKDFLSYAESGHLNQPEVTERPPDSDFEIAVIDALQREGFECVPQVGVAGFYIDIAVKDPGKPGKYLMGIECDGATYHSAKSVRDRDRLRQQVLEGLGWKIRRIWSTDWYKNPKAEITPILQELNATKSEIILDVEPELQEPIYDLDEGVDSVENIDDQEEVIAEDVVEPRPRSVDTTHVEVSELVDEKILEIKTPKSLREKLEYFAQNVVEKECPETPRDKRILRTQMLEKFLDLRPLNTWEFQEEFPKYLRSSVHVDEGKYLKQILKIIEQHEEDCEFA